jgi:hypothetical protein
MGQTYNSTIINAPIDKVWNKIRNFHDMSWTPNAVESCKAVGDKSGNQVGAGRLLNGAISEKLVEIDEQDHRYRYQITEGPSPISSKDVQNYYGEFRLRPITDAGATFVEISSKWEGKDGDVSEFCNPIYSTFLKEMKATVES